MCNGRWLMRDRQLLTLDEAALREAAREHATRIDAFLASREVSVLQKLVAVGGAVEQESFEVQVKARIPAAEQVLTVIAADELTVDPRQPLSPVRYLLVVRRSRPGLAALSRGRVPRRERAA